jgi:hypothetical protein
VKTQGTSAQAYHQAVASGEIPTMRMKVAYAFQKQLEGTAAEVLFDAGLDHNRNLMRARVTELADEGLIIEVARRACQITGRKAIVWRYCSQPVRRVKPDYTAEQVADITRRVEIVLSRCDVIGARKAALADLPCFLKP